MLRASKYPNVMVDCPECIPTATHNPVAFLALGGSLACPTCKGEGKVPSAEEFAIHDHEGFEGINIGEFTSIREVAALAQCLDEEGEAFAVYLRYGGMVAEDDAQTMLDSFRDHYRGTYRSAEDYAEELFREIHDIPDFLDSYIDWERVARDMEIGGDIWTHEGGDGVYVFDNH